MDDAAVRVELIAETVVDYEATPPGDDPRRYRLGRHVVHDERSREYPAEQSSHLKTVFHQRWAPILDQGQLSSCTGNAMAGLLGTAPRSAPAGFTVDEALALKLYELGTTLDGIPGAYPPDDTGSSGLAVAKAAKHLGLCTAYRHAFGLGQALAALVLRPVIIGIPWYDSFDQPGPNGLISISPNAGVRGGHELELTGIDVALTNVRGANSWGAGWGDQGYFTMSWTTFDRLLHEQGDVTTVH